MAGSAVPVVVIVLLSAVCAHLALVQRVVPAQHQYFVLFVAAYAAFANVYICRSAGPGFKPLGRRSLAPLKSVRLLFPFTLLLSLFTPTAMLLLAPTCGVRPPHSQLHAILAPHLFLMLSQIVLETVGFVFAEAALIYVRLGVTTALISYRLPVLFDWYWQSLTWPLTEEAAALPHYAPVVIQAAAVLNIVYWTFSLLCFMLLYCVPALINNPQFLSNKKPSTSTPNRKMQ